MGYFGGMWEVAHFPREEQYDAYLLGKDIAHDLIEAHKLDGHAALGIKSCRVRNTQR